MASSRHYSNGADWRDVAAVAVAFEAINKVKLELRLSTEVINGASDLRVTILAHNQGIAIGDQPPLGSVSVTCSAMYRRTLEDVLIQALYSLDGKLATGAFKETLNG